jgi:hypothetical protein
VSKSGKDRRKSKRFRKRAKIRFWWADFEGTGFTSDISDTGLLIETNKPIEIGSRLNIEVTHGEDSFFGTVVIVRQKTYPRQARSMFKPALGARFLKITEVMGVSAEQELKDEPGAEEVAEQQEVQEEPAPPPVPEDIPLLVDLREHETLAEIYERDVKHGGLRVITTEIAELQSDIEVPVLLPEPHGQIICTGLVVKLFEDPPGFSVHLDDVDAVRARLIEIMRSA